MNDEGIELKKLFEVELVYKEGKPPVSEDGKVGEYLGSGEGTLEGPDVRGTVHWTLFEEQRETHCESNLFGVITTEDGAAIHFDTMGFFLRPDTSNPHQWISSASVSFQTDDERYLWLNPILGMWEGEFDMQAYKHHYRAYAGAGS